MNFLSIAIIIFIIMESLNVIILYFKPESKKGNGVAVFNSYTNSKKDEITFKFIQYLINWVAGTKLIFIVLLIVILFTGTETTKLYAVIVMILSIATYYWRLHPIIKDLDNLGEITPKGYSKTLGMMIFGFLLMFFVVLVLYFVNGIYF